MLAAGGNLPKRLLYNEARKWANTNSIVNSHSMLMSYKVV